MKDAHMPRSINNLTLVSCAILALSGCGGGSGSKRHETEGTQALVQQIQKLEASGQLPKLDRSSDIRGPDVDNNGIRDDIDAWIAALPISDKQKRAARQMARVQQAKILVNLSDKGALQAIGDRSMAGVKCLRLAFMPDFQAGYDLGSQLEAMMANTKERAKQYIAYNRARSGSVTELPSGDTCEP